MKMISSLIVAAMLTFGSPAVADHSGPTVVQLGIPMVYMAPVCLQESDAVSVIDVLRESGFDASLAAYRELVAVGLCADAPGPLSFTPTRVVVQFEDALVVEAIVGGGVLYILMKPAVLSGQEATN